MALAVALAHTGAAWAQTWVPVIANDAKAQFDLDAGSVTANGGFIQTWIRETLPHREREAVTGKPYVAVLMQRLDDCRARTFAIAAYVYKDEKGQVAASQTVPQAEWRFVSPPPGSVAAAVQTRICDVARQRATLKPGLGYGPAVKANWLPVAYDPANQTRYFVDQDNVMSMAGGRIGVILRAENSGTRKLADGTPIATSFMADIYDCKARMKATVMVDSYDAAGTLVAVYAPAREKVEPEAYLTGSSADLIAKYACDPAHLKAPAQDSEAGQTSSGTAWMGPKGYLITANHVVEGATKLELAQDGKLIGHAEIVVLDPANDIAILKPVFDDGPHAAIQLSVHPAQLGEKVFTLGYPAPDLLGFSVKMTSGEVSALAGADVQSHRVDDARFLQVSIPIQSGNSGGPVIDAEGRVVGIVISKMNMVGEKEVAQNTNYALKIGYIRNLLSDLPALGPPRPARTSASISGLVADLKGSVVMVIATQGKAP